MAVQAVTTGTAGTYGTDATGTTQSDQFLRLLVTQIQNQDPFSPMDNQAFINQLTQLSSLEQLQTINERLGESLLVNQSLNNTLLLDLVGRHATVLGDGVTVAGGAASQSLVRTSAGGTATCEVRNASGQVVATYQRAATAGQTDVTWDGRLADGTVAADGQYTLSVTVADRAGTPITASLFQTGVVDSIRYENNVAIVTIGGRDYYVSEIAQVSR